MQPPAPPLRSVRDILEKQDVPQLKLQVNHAAQLGDADRLYLLLKAAAQLNNQQTLNQAIDVTETKNQDNATPLFQAAKNGNLECVKLLINARACVTAKTKAGFTPLWIASLRGKHEVLALLLKQYGVAVNQPALDGRTPLYAACESGNAECVRLLIRAGASLESKRNDDTTPLIVAAYFGHESVVELLLEQGASLFPRDEDGNALDNARRQKRWRCVDLILQALDDRGMTESDLPQEGDIVIPP